MANSWIYCLKKFLFLLVISVLYASMGSVQCAHCMSLVKYLATNQDKNISVKKQSMSFYGAKLSEIKDTTVPFPAYNLQISYKGKKLIKPDPENMIYYYGSVDPEEMSIAKDFPKPNMVTLVARTSAGGHGSYSMIILTAFDNTVSVSEVGYKAPAEHVYPDEKEHDIFIKPSGLIKALDGLWNIQTPGENCPHMSFGCPGCSASAPYFLCFKASKWVPTKSGEYKNDYLNLAQGIRNSLDKYILQKKMTAKQFIQDYDANYGILLARLSNCYFLAGLPAEENIKRLQPYMPQKCARELLKQLSGETTY